MFGDGEGLGMMMMMTTSTSTSTRVAPQPQWSQQETKDFIRIRAEVENINTSKRTKTTTLWELVSAQMRDAGYTRTPDQCKCKWKNLLNRYKVFFLLFISYLQFFPIILVSVLVSLDLKIRNHF